MKPSFKHDCNDCKFVGKIFTALVTFSNKSPKKKAVDLYESCETGGSKYILRCSSKGGDYITTNDFLAYMA